MTIIKQYNDNTAQWEAIAVGQKGDTGPGVANGGVTDAVLIKASNTDFDTTWSQDLNLTTLQLSSTLTAADILPSAANTYDLGSVTNTWKDLYLSGNSIFLGNVTITESEWDNISTGVLPYDGTISGLSANTVKEAIDETVSLTATAYSNAVAYADAVGNSAYSNAISYTDTAVANLIDTAPDALNTLNELSAALNDDPDFANTIVGQITTAYTNATSYTDSEITALGLGSISTQNANNVNIDGGTIDGTAVNATTLTASGDVNFDSGTLFVDASTNNVGIGTTSSYAKLQIDGGVNTGAIRISEGGHNGVGSTFLYPVASYYARKDNIVRTNNDPLSNNGSTASIVFTDEPGNFAFPNAVRSSSILFYTADNNNGGSVGIVPTERMRIESRGHVIIPAGVTLGTSAGVYNAANTLDDYEEGTWTLNLTDGTNSINFGTQRYVKIGKIVHLFCLIRTNVSSTSGWTSNPVYITGAPFTCEPFHRSTAATNIRGGGGVNYNNLIVKFNRDSTTIIDLIDNDNSSSTFERNVPGNQFWFGGALYLNFCLTYRV